MKDSMRARVAGVVGAVSKGHSVLSVFDYSLGGYRNISVSLNNGQVSGYDYNSSSHFSSSGSGNFDFFDYETSNHVQLKINGNNFEGYDYYSGKHFSGSVNNRSLSLFDYETSQYHNFSI